MFRPVGNHCLLPPPRSKKEKVKVANPVHEPGEIEFPNSASPLTRYDTVVVQDDDDDDDDDE